MTPKRRVLGYQAGVSYPSFIDVERVPLARVFEDHGFERSSRRLRDFDPPRALAVVAARIGPQRRDRLRISPLDHLERDKGHLVGYQIDRLMPRRDATQSFPGARLYATKERIVVTAAATGEYLPDCKALAEHVRGKATRLVEHADIGTVSRAVTYVFEESDSLPFIAKGSHVLLGGTGATDRVVSCLHTIRKFFYDDARRAGLRATVIEILDTPANRRAVVDAVIDDWQRSALSLVDQLRSDVAEAPRRDMTLERRREHAEEFLRSLRKRRAMAPEPADKLREIGTAVAAAYSEADGRPTVVPDWLDKAVESFSRPA
jgi:hypothetical protein